MLQSTKTTKGNTMRREAIARLVRDTQVDTIRTCVVYLKQCADIARASRLSSNVIMASTLEACAKDLTERANGVEASPLPSEFLPTA
jgi:hypothetical protein